MTLRLNVVLCGLLGSAFLTPAYAGAPIATTGLKTIGMRGQKVRQEARALRGANPNLKQVLAEQAADPHIAKVLAHSAKNGNYYVVSDLHFGIGKAHPNGAFDRQEDFTRGDVWQKTLDHISRQKGNNTLVIGGDGLDLLEHVNPEDGLDKVGDAIGQMVKGHTAEWKALAKAVVHDGLRVVYLRGNHDIRLLDATGVAHGGASIRQRFIEEIMNAGELTPTERDVFQSRVAFAGHAAPLGKFGEMMVYHGEQQDPTNSWRSPANPYSYGKDGTRAIPRTLGDQIVRREWVNTETANPDGDNTTESAMGVVAKRILTDPKANMHALQLLWAVSKHKGDSGPSQRLAERIDDRATLQEWAKRTGFDQMQNTTLDGKTRNLSSRTYAKQLEGVTRRSRHRCRSA